MSDIDLVKLKELAEDTASQFGAEWDSALVAGENGNYHAIICEEKDDFVISTGSDKRESSWLCDYLEAVDPSTVTALIELQEATQRANAAQDDHINQQHLRINWLEAANSGLGKALGSAEAELKRRDAQEPVAWLNVRHGDPTWPRVFLSKEKADENRKWVELAPMVNTVPLYAAAPAAVPEKVVNLPELCVGVVQSGKAVMVTYKGGHWFNKTAILEALDAAGVKWKEAK